MRFLCFMDTCSAGYIPKHETEGVVMLNKSPIQEIGESLDEMLQKEKQAIIDAFLFGFSCGGKSDDPEALAEIYYEIQYGGRNES